MTTFSPTKLFDQQGREVTYLRLSVTDRCDLRCHYCLPERPKFLPKSEILNLETLLFLTEVFVKLGISKIRITGGEPLVRKNVLWLIEEINKIPQLKELVLTTNGTLLSKYASKLKQIGVGRLNISLDTLQKDKFKELTRTGDLQIVLDGIAAACDENFNRIRLNTVLMRGFNDDELVDLVNFAILHNIDISFIEEMPMGEIDRNRPLVPFSADDLFLNLQAEFNLIKSEFTSGGPAQYWSIPNTNTKVGVIAPHTRNFCSNCNRVRLTCTGNLYPCLGHMGKVSLSEAAKVFNEEKCRELIFTSLQQKPAGHEFDMQSQTAVLRYMAETGG